MSIPFKSPKPPQKVVFGAKLTGMVKAPRLSLQEQQQWWAIKAPSSSLSYIR